MAVRRHWPWMTAVPIIMLAIALALAQRSSDSSRAQAQVSGASPPPAAPTIEDESVERIYRRAQKLRADLALTNSDLAALGVSAATARQVLGVVKAAASVEPDPLMAADAAERAAAINLAEAVRKINVGPRDESVISSIPGLKQRVREAKAQRAVALSGLAAQVLSVLSPDQQALWQAAQANAGRQVPGSFRYAAGLTDVQVQQLDLEARRGGAAGAATAATRILSGSQTAQAQAAADNQRISAAAVAVAEAEVLPLPQSLRATFQSTNTPPVSK